MTVPPSPPQSQRAIDGGHIKGAADVPRCIEIALFSTLGNGKTMRNVFHGEYVSVPVDMQTLALNLWTSMSASWSAQLANLMYAQTNFVRVEVRDMADHTNPIFTGTGTAVPGTAVGIAMPNQNAIVLTENINARGKGLKGRVYLGGFAIEADAGAGVIADVAFTNCNLFGEDVFANISSESLQPCVAQPHRQEYIGLTGALIPDRPAATVLVNSYAVKDKRWDIQRRRA